MEHFCRSRTVKDFHAIAGLEFVVQIGGKRFAGGRTSTERLQGMGCSRIFRVQFFLGDEHLTEERWNAEEQGCLVLADQSEDMCRRRRIGIQDGSGADRHGEEHGITETVSEEETSRRVNNILFRNFKDVFPVVLRTVLHVGLGMDCALRTTGGTGCVKPESDIIGRGEYCFKFLLCCIIHLFVW
ncbi:MAG: hypothetical protein A4E66_02626 [Syntrophus sp. PtaB.Bin001]|nr:MAG: hypothetical protein A4E66_02626 [Syntrophus sp. PtaB.Bin001]